MDDIQLVSIRREIDLCMYVYMRLCIKFMNVCVPSELYRMATFPTGDLEPFKVKNMYHTLSLFHFECMYVCM